MTTKEFLIELADVLQTEDNLELSSNLSNSEYWDSIAQMAVMSFMAKKFGVHASLEDITMTDKVSDIVDLVKEHLED